MSAASSAVASPAFALLFPGQGAQFVGMGQALAGASQRAREVFERADEALGFSISKLCFEGPEDQLVLTKFTQPAIVTASIAALEALREVHPDLPAPAFVAGHSLGEYSALVAAGALTLEDAVRLVHLRGRAMQDAVPPGEGAMAAIMGGDEEAVESLCRDASQGEALSPANFNAPGQIVIAGTKAAVDRAAELAKSRSLKAILLKVSAPFHCALMAPAAREVAAALENVKVERPAFPVVTNVEAAPNQDPARVRSLLVQQVDHAVRWDASIRFVASAGVTHAFEVGPGKVLSNLIKRIDKNLAVLSVGAPEDLVRVPEFLAIA